MKCESCKFWERCQVNIYQGDCSKLTEIAGYIVKDANIMSLEKVRTDSLGTCKHHVKQPEL